MGMEPYFLLTLLVGSYTNEANGGGKWFKAVENGSAVGLAAV